LPCILAVLVLAFPRLAIILLYLLTDLFKGIYDTLLVPILGFIFMPVTLVAYTWLTKTGRPVDAFYLVVIFIAVIVDFGMIGGGRASRKKRIESRG
jgi:hypothetical protein